MPPTRPLLVAVDGPAASGKGTLARRLARHFGLRYLDTGLLYRAVGAEALRRGLSLDGDEAALAAIARELDLASVSASAGGGGGEDRRPELRTDAAAQAASRVSALPAVRAALLSAQRAFAAPPPSSEGGGSGAVLDGRDIGTVVCPEADAKIFVTASPEVRAERRWREQLLRRRREEGGGAVAAAAAAPPTLATVLADLRARDARDAGRAASPLRPAEGAFVLDTSEMDAGAAFEAARAYVEGRARARAKPNDRPTLNGSSQ